MYIMESGALTLNIFMFSTSGAAANFRVVQLVRVAGHILRRVVGYSPPKSVLQWDGIGLGFPWGTAKYNFQQKILIVGGTGRLI